MKRAERIEAALKTVAEWCEGHESAVRAFEIIRDELLGAKVDRKRPGHMWTWYYNRDGRKVTDCVRCGTMKTKANEHKPCRGRVSW